MKKSKLHIYCIFNIYHLYEEYGLKNEETQDLFHNCDPSILHCQRFYVSETEIYHVHSNCKFSMLHNRNLILIINK